MLCCAPMDVEVRDGICTKHASAVDEAGRLRHEAEVLRRLGHPGVVELRDLQDDGDEVWMGTVAVEGTPLPSGAVDVGLAGRVAAGVATTLADLHDSGVTHGAVEAVHVLIDPEDRPILCSLGRSVSTDPPDAGAAADVAAL